MSARSKTDTSLADIIEIISVVFTISRTGQEPVASGTPKILLGILRADYHVVSLWDISAEARVMHFEETGVTETGGLVGVWRHLGNNVKIGVGYQFNDISDDLRQIEGRKEGLFLSIIAKF